MNNKNTSSWLEKSSAGSDCTQYSPEEAGVAPRAGWSLTCSSGGEVPHKVADASQALSCLR
ncbi:hypothetical protein E2C01_013071 [Portunus trituberculatus]|uniref:Uncharacterized protein n=1 Tax=Portunus trituberculatus TaxID=210409 RepID=A0A5B7DG37_PORTR|nr:hypothetical protein [Portunus trituberculatus]